MGLQTAALGTIVSTAALPPVKLQNGERIIACVLSNDVLVAKVHSFKFGKVYCNGGLCCKSDPGFVQVRYLIPVAYCAVDNQLNPLAGAEVFVRPLSRSNNNGYRWLVDQKQLNGGNIAGMNILINCIDTEYQKYEFSVHTRFKHPFYAGNQIWENAVKEGMQFYAQHIESFAMELSDEELQQKLAAAAQNTMGGAQAPQLPNFGGVPMPQTGAPAAPMIGNAQVTTAPQLATAPGATVHSINAADLDVIMGRKQ